MKLSDRARYAILIIIAIPFLIFAALTIGEYLDMETSPTPPPGTPHNFFN